MSARHDDEGLTSGEWQDALGWSQHKTIQALRSLVRGGKMSAGRAVRQSMCGVMHPVPVYRLKG